MQALLKENRGIIAAAQRERLTQDGFVSTNDTHFLRCLQGSQIRSSLPRNLPCQVVRSFLFFGILHKNKSMFFRHHSRK